MIWTAEVRQASKANSEKQRITDLEEQLKQLSCTAAAALDRVSELEQQIEQLSEPRRLSMSSSSSSLSSRASSFEGDTLEKLERAIKVIHHARTELREPSYFQYN